MYCPNIEYHFLSITVVFVCLCRNLQLNQSKSSNSKVAVSYTANFYYLTNGHVFQYRHNNMRFDNNSGYIISLLHWREWQAAQIPQANRRIISHRRVATNIHYRAREQDQQTTYAHWKETLKSQIPDGRLLQNVELQLDMSYTYNPLYLDILTGPVHAVCCATA